MHMVIAALVRAEDEGAALDEAKSVFDGLAESGDFDYYTTFDENGTEVSGRGR